MFKNQKFNLKILVVFFSVILVASFSCYKWVTLLHRYGNYGSYVAKTDEGGMGGKFIFSYLGTDTTSFEEETIYREAIKYQYAVAFAKIWTFGAFVFSSAFLILVAIPNKNNSV